MMRTGRQARAFFPATAAGLLLAFAHAAPALEIGALVPGSRLGEPLSAAVPVRLAAGESLAPGCVTVTGTDGGLPAVAGIRATVTPVLGPATASIRLDSPRPLTEPAYGLSVRVACPGVTASVREFEFTPDLPGTAAGPMTVQPATPAAAEVPGLLTPPVIASPTAGADDRTAAPAGAGPGLALTPLAPGARHVVQAGETLWSIAVRATAPGGSPRLTATAIHAANRQAFLAGDPARLMAGSTLLIPAETAALAVADPPASGASDGYDASASPAGRTDTGETTADAPPASTAPAGEMAAAAADRPDASEAGNPADGAGTPGELIEATAEAAGATLAAAAAPLPAPAATVAPAPAPRPRPARQPPAAGPARPPQPAGADPLASALAGAAFGFLASGPLWWRSRRRPRAAAEPVGRPEPVKVAMPVAAARPAIDVSFEPLPAGEPPMDGAAVAASGSWLQQSEETTRSQRLRPADDITAELEELFNTAPGESSGDTTSRRPWAPGNSMIDLPALAQGSDTDEHQAQGLRDALALLEQDYEQEWTGSRVRPVVAEPSSPEATPTAPLRRLG
jgi:Tfp pilus assembly protein FimV